MQMHIVINSKENFLDFEIMQQLCTAHDIALLYEKDKKYM